MENPTLVLIRMKMNALISDLTALISEHYYPKKFVEWIIWSNSNYWDENNNT